ncbi:MAG: TIR domain-containing protein [Crocinitomix sp.]|nr:TIR domain-containing protein [Crocinitomix sp.]
MSPPKNELSPDDKGKKGKEQVPEEFIHNFNSGIIRKSEYFDLFISYKRDNGGDHGQKLAVELHQKLTADGYKVWLDNEEIGFSNNFEQRIEEAILHSKKIACIIGPQWVESPNCRYETKKAIEFEKRIIPIHYQEFRTLLKSKKDEGELTLDQWNRIDKPQEIDFSDKSKYQKAYEDLKAVCDLNDDITAQHNRISCESYYWQKYNKPKSMLPFGTYLSKAKLLRSKCNSDDELPSFTNLQDEFLAAADEFVSSEVSHHRLAYISYAPSEYAFASELNLELKLNGVLTWFEELSDEPTAKDSILAPVINCDNLIEIASESTPKEDDERKAYARANNKRIIQVTESAELLKAKRADGVKNIYLWNDQVRIDELITTINGDAVYNAAHAMLLQQAFAWEKSDKSNSKLLPLKDANSAKAWYQKSEKAGTEPQPNLSMVNFAERSVAYAETLRKRKVGLLITAALGIVLLIILGWSAKIALDKADEAEENAALQTKIAEEKALDAEKAEKDALRSQKDALRAEKDAALSLEDAAMAEIAAIKALDKANKATKAAAEALALAAESKAKADSSEAKANASLVKAAASEDRAKQARIDADLANKELAKTTLKTNAAKLSLEAFELTLDGKYDEAQERADAAVALYNQIEGENFETDLLYNTYYSILSKTNKDSLSNEGQKFIQDYPMSADNVKLKHCSYAIDNTFSWNTVKDIGADRNLAYCLVYSENRKYGALGLKNGKIYLFDVAGKVVIDTVSVGTYRVTSMDFNSTGSQLVASTVNEKFAIIPLDIASGKRNLKKQIIRKETFARIEEIEFLTDNTIRAFGGAIEKDGGIKKTYRKYAATVEKLTTILE